RSPVPGGGGLQQRHPGRQLRRAAGAGDPEPDLPAQRRGARPRRLRGGRPRRRRPVHPRPTGRRHTMTHIYDDPAHFKTDVIDGFAAAYSPYVRRVPHASGIVRQDGPRAGKDRLEVGGGPGHYPPYAGTVGPGLADGCVLGDVFTSPSAEQVYRVGRAAAGGAGLVLAFGNYAGDRLNFAAARERLL